MSMIELMKNAVEVSFYCLVSTLLLGLIILLTTGVVFLILLAITDFKDYKRKNIYRDNE